MKEYHLKTTSRMEMVNIDRYVADAILESGIKEGICLVFAPHTTAAITINENADPAVRKDIIKELAKLFPYDGDYFHSEGNSDAHIKSSAVGCSQTLIVSGGKPMLGTWQSVFFCEFDGPRQRNIWITVRG
jgi:secondary thiamine-phosphate synthase enzyme